MKADRVYVWYCRNGEKPWHRCDKLLCTKFKINGFQSEFDKRQRLCGHQIWLECDTSKQTKNGEKNV